MRRLAVFLVFLLGISPGAALYAESLTTEYQLDNGLKLIVREDHRAPTLVVQVWYKVGSSYEPNGLTGISHALEHMMFKGTTKVPDGEFSRIVALHGGEDNAFTTSDYTAYYQKYTADKLELALELEADRMANLVLKPESFAQEIRVIMEERRLRTDDNPQALARERFMTMTWPTSSARQPTIGWMSDLQKLKVEDLKQWYETWYAPNNATIVVAGDVKSDDVRKMVDHYFAAIPSRTIPDVDMPKELPEPGDRRITLQFSGKVPALYLAYNVPSLLTGKPGDAEALRMMAGVMDEGMSARLETRLVRDQRIAAAVNSGYDAFDRGDTLFMVTAVPAPGKTMEQLEQAILAEIEKLKTEAISDGDLQRVYAGYLSGEVFQRDSVQAQAMNIGSLESSGYSWKVQDEWLKKLKDVTADQVRQVAQTFLVPSRRSIMYLLPTSEEKAP